MQASASVPSRVAPWTPPSGPLGALTDASRARAVGLPRALDAWRGRLADAPPARPFAEALRRETIAVIAEVKRASPSKGAIAPGLDAVAQARAYVRGGAAAISILTEPSRFGGSLDDLAAVAAAVEVPVIRKDFLVEPAQLFEARALGASAALLIVRAIAPEALAPLVEAGREAGLGLLVEVRDAVELARALAAGAEVIGVNNRDLETLVIDPGTAPALLPAIPAACIGVAESGMAVPVDAAASVAAGADALLVGSAISAAADPAAAVAAFAALARVPRAAQADQASAAAGDASVARTA